MGNVYSYAIAHIEKEFVAVQNLSSNEEAPRRNITYQELRNISTSDDMRLNLDHIAILYSMDANRDGVFSYDDLVAFAMWCATNLPKDITGSEFSDAVQARCVLRLWSDCKEKGNDAFVEWMCGFLQRAHPCEGPRGTPFAQRSRSQSEAGRTRKSSVHSGSHNSRRLSHGSGGVGGSTPGASVTGHLYSTSATGGDGELFPFNPPQSVNTEKLSGSVNSNHHNNHSTVKDSRRNSPTAAGQETQRPSVGNASITGSQGSRGGGSSSGTGTAGGTGGGSGTGNTNTGFRIDFGDSPTHLASRGPHATVAESFEVPSSETDDDLDTDDEQELKVLPPGGAGRGSNSTSSGTGVGGGGAIEKMEWFDLDALDTLYTLLNVKEGYGLDFHTFCHVLSGEPGAESAPTGRGGEFGSGIGGGESPAGRTAHSFTWSRSIAAARSADTKAGALGFGNTQEEDLFIPGASVRTFLMAFLESYWGILQRLGLGVLLESNLDELSPDSPLGPERRQQQAKQQHQHQHQQSHSSAGSTTASSNQPQEVTIGVPTK